MSKLVSPNDLHTAACRAYGFHEPRTMRQWEMCVNFWAANIGTPVELAATKIMARLFDCPVSESRIEEIVRFQQNAKTKRKS